MTEHPKKKGVYPFAVTSELRDLVVIVGLFRHLIA